MKTNHNKEGYITAGAGLQRSLGKRLQITPWNLENIKQKLGSLPVEENGWWSAHCWKDERRRNDNWECSWGLVLDLDYGQYTCEESTPERNQKKFKNCLLN